MTFTLLSNGSLVRMKINYEMSLPSLMNTALHRRMWYMNVIDSSPETRDSKKYNAIIGAASEQF